MIIDIELSKMLKDFSNLKEVKGILLAGSRAVKTNDESSDYDIYIYSNCEISKEQRKTIEDKYCSYMELNNTFWEAEDDGILRASNTPVEIIYRNLNLLADSLEKTLVKHEANVGYSTCFWANVLNSIILYDKDGELKSLQDKCKINYPKKLKENIIKKNYPLLKKQIPAYYYQIEKAIKRNDIVSVNHRTAAMLASYFDIIFAINEIPHPGEKKLLKIIKDKNLKVPENMEKNIINILNLSASNNPKILNEIDSLVCNLDKLLIKKGFALEKCAG